MKKALFFSGGYLSHIKPILPLMKSMFELKYDIYVIGNPQYRDLYERYGYHFLAMPEYENEKLDNEVSRIIEILPQSENLDKYIFLNNEQSLLSMHNFSGVVFNELCTIVEKEINPDVIFKDAINIYADPIACKFHIPIVGYITNILYNKNFFAQNPPLLYSIFSRSIGYKDYLIDSKFVDDYAGYLNELNDYIENKYNLYHKDVFQQFDPDEQINFIFASKYVQPTLYSKNKNIVWLPKNILSKDSVRVDRDITELYKNKKKLVYISNGSFINIGTKIFEKLIIFLDNYDVDIVINGGANTKILMKFVKENHFNNKIVIKNFIPQRNVLKHCSLFITHGGFNSLLEGTIYKVPMLILPISPEQRLNGFIWDNKGISYTDYKANKKNTGEIIDEILTGNYNLKNLKKYSNLLKSELSNEQDLVVLLKELGF